MSAIQDPKEGVELEPVVIGAEAYTSQAYAKAEADRLWAKVWQVACREEEIPNVGDYVTYDILDESIVVTRVSADKIAAYYNVCPHRGRRLTDGCGHAKKFVCRYHGWKWDLDGENSDVLWREDYGDALSDADIRLRKVNVDTWGGWVFINMDPNCESLKDYLGAVPSILDPFEPEKMRYRWRQWFYAPCNWKVAIEAFQEGYHVSGTHPQLTRIGGAKKSWSKAYGKHAVFGTNSGASGAAAGAAGAKDLRKAIAESVEELWETLNASTTETIVNAAKRLVDELPEDAPPEKVNMHLIMSAMKDDAARGVIWPKLTPDQVQKAGVGWNIFPNTMILHGPTFALCYRARPNGANPDSCIFEIYVIERFPEGQEPKPEPIFHSEMREDKVVKIVMQDYGNMAAVQEGMKSRGYAGARPNPVQEGVVINFHKQLASFMGVGAPIDVKK